MSVFEGGLERGTLVLHLYGQRVLILRSRGKEPFKLVGEPILLS